MPAWLARWVVRAGDAQRALLSVIYAIIGPRAAYAVSDACARTMLVLLPNIREQIEVELRAALPQLSRHERRKLATLAFVHRLRNLADLLLASRLLHARTYRRFGGELGPADRAGIADAADQSRPIVFVTGYCGPFDLLPIYLGLNGVRLTVVYRHHTVAGFDRLRRRIRAISGCELVAVEHAASATEEALSAGRAVAVVADNADDPRGVPVEFLGKTIRAARTVGLLAARHDAEVVVAGIRRTGDPFHVRIATMDSIKPPAWRGEPEPVAYITRRVFGALDRIIREAPEQYLWEPSRRDAASRSGGDEPPGARGSASPGGIGDREGQSE